MHPPSIHLSIHHPSTIHPPSMHPPSIHPPSMHSSTPHPTPPDDVGVFLLPSTRHHVSGGDEGERPGVQQCSDPVQQLCQLRGRGHRTACFPDSHWSASIYCSLKRLLCLWQIDGYGVGGGIRGVSGALGFDKMLLAFRWCAI